LESRAFAKEEMNRLLTKLLAQATPTQRKVVEGIIKDESVNYVPLQHKKPLLENLWQVSDAIVQEHPIRFSYTRQDGRTKDRTVKPLAIIFSEFYFYLIGLQTYETGDAFRTYRLDRIANIITSEEKFRIPYRDKFRDSEFRKRVQFMYDGELMTVKFRYFGSSVEHVLDRLPTAKAKQRDVGVYDISAEVYGDGILIWLLSQGSQVEVYAPEELRQQWLDEASRIVASCDAKEGAWRQ
jgi:predicted DNA-binding transcriptional regulator YafY